MSDKHDPSDGTPHIKVTVYSPPCESEEWPSIDNFNVFLYPGRNHCILDSVFRFQCSAGRTERYITPGGADNRYCRIIVAD